MSRSDFAPFVISIPLSAALVFNIILLVMIPKFNGYEALTQRNITTQTMIVSAVEAILAGLTFWLQTWGLELLILISSAFLLASSNILYLKLGKQIALKD